MKAILPSIPLMTRPRKRLREAPQRAPPARSYFSSFENFDPSRLRPPIRPFWPKMYAIIGDALVSNMGGFTGIYDRSSQVINGRSVYVERSRRSAVLAYCQQEKAYTFTILAGLFHNSTTDLDPCLDWTAKSVQTESYDITAVAKDWLIRRNSLVDEGVQMKSFKLSCNDCDRKENVAITPRSGKSQGCKYHGVCTSSDEAPIGPAGGIGSSSNFVDLTPGKRCRCDDGRYGPTCEFRMVSKK